MNGIEAGPLGKKKRRSNGSRHRIQGLLYGLAHLLRRLWRAFGIGAIYARKEKKGKTSRSKFCEKVGLLHISASDSGSVLDQCTYVCPCGDISFFFFFSKFQT